MFDEATPPNKAVNIEDIFAKAEPPSAQLKGSTTGPEPPSSSKRWLIYLVIGVVLLAITLTAKATDNSGAQTTSGGVSVSIASLTSPSQIKLEWGNITNSTPYYHEYQRSTSSPDIRFKETDPSLYMSPRVGVYNNLTPPSQMMFYSVTDSDLQEAITYYYRIRACSSIDLIGSYATPQIGNSGKPNPACGEFSVSDATTGSSVAAEFVQKSVVNVTPRYLFAKFSDAVSGAGIEKIFGFASKVWSGFKEKLGETAWWIENKLVKLMNQEPEVVEGQTTIEKYYLHAATTTGPVYIDENVEPDTVYLYRVRVHYEDGRENPFTEWSNLGAVKTMKDVSGGNFPEIKRPICIRNSYCDNSLTLYKSSANPNKIPMIEESEQQCSINADCRDVGRADQSYRER